MEREPPPEIVCEVQLKKASGKVYDFSPRKTISAAAREQGGFMHALVVDDSKTIRLLLREQLKHLGFEVTEANDGLQALNSLKDMPRVDLVLVDWNMPEMDGIAFVRAVRAESNYTTLPMMMVTTNAELAQVSKALEAGVNEYIMKPFTAEILREKLQLLGFPQV
jgi:two-component system chemotaxis response regulator CheY